MRKTLTKAFLILLLTVAAVPSLAQQNGAVGFSYDANGNRIARIFSFQDGNGGRGGEDYAATPMLATATDTLASVVLTLFPNPTDGHFSVGVDNADGGVRMGAVLYAPTGVIVSSKTLDGSRTDFDLSGHAAGVYVLRIEAVGETRIWKVVKH